MKKLLPLLLCLALLSACAAPPAQTTAPSPPPVTAAPPTLPPIQTQTAPPTTEPLPLPQSDEELVRVRDYAPELKVELKYAGTDNFTGQVIYGFSDAYLRWGTLKKLMAVDEALREEGYALLIWDAFRPASAQFRLWEVCPDPTYVADPNVKFSAHTRGNTVDVTLIAVNRRIVEVPTDFDDFSPKADRDYSDCTQVQRENAQRLQTAMENGGFTGYFMEWWHFTDTDTYEPETQFDPGA